MLLPDRFPRAASLALILLLFVPGPVLGQWSGGPDVRVNQDPPGLNQNETSLTLNPALPGNLLMVYNDQPWPGGPGLGYSYSFDSGMSWKDGQFALPAGMLMFFDPMAAADLNGILYAGGCANNNVANGNSGVYLYASADGGLTWTGPVVVSSDGPQPPPQPATLNDRGHMIVDDNPTSPFVNHVHVTWMKDVGTVGPFGDTWFNTSPPGGTAFVGRQKISDPASGLGRVHAPHVASASDGVIYVVWADYDITTSQSPAVLYLDRSFDGGTTFGTDIWINNPMQITTLPRFFTELVGPPTQGDTAPIVATHPTHPQDVYVVYAADPDGALLGDEGDIYFIRSADRGVNWAPPVKVNQPPYNVGHQYAPWIDVKPDGTIDVAWYDGQLLDGSPVLWSVAMSRSVDGGATWVGPLVVSDSPVPAPVNPMAQSRWLGEYLALVVDSTWAHVGFASSVSDPVGDIYFDRVRNSVFGDCDGNGIPDFADMIACGGATWCDDCNSNQILDACDVNPSDPDGDGSVSPDTNGNGIPDECEGIGVGDAQQGGFTFRALPSVTRSATFLSFGARLPGVATVTIFDAAGRAVRTLAVEAGTRGVLWDGVREDGTKADAGLYFAQLVHGGGRAGTRLVIVR